jgi:hypothetical protein
MRLWFGAISPAGSPRPTISQSASSETLVTLAQRTPGMSLSGLGRDAGRLIHSASNNIRNSPELRSSAE